MFSVFFSSDNINYDIFFKLRPYGGLIGIDKTSLDKYLKKSQCLQLRVILHDAAVFIQNPTKKVPCTVTCSLEL